MQMFADRKRESGEQQQTLAASQVEMASCETKKTNMEERRVPPGPYRLQLFGTFVGSCQDEETQK